MRNETIIDALARWAGIEPSYHDVEGKVHFTGERTTRELLQAMGIPDEAEQAERFLEEQRSIERERILGAVSTWPIVWGAPRLILGPSVGIGTRAEFYVKLESGETVDGAVAITEYEGRPYLQLGRELPLGYHELTVRAGGREVSSRIIVVPERCYIPDSMAAGQRVWGISAQLYSLRSKLDRGIGTFADLETLLTGAGGQGAALVGLNPLHAGFFPRADNISPYSPSSRLARNPLYIDPERVPELAWCGEARALLARQSNDHSGDAAAQSSGGLIDYARISPIRDSIFKMLYRELMRSGETALAERRQKFEHFCAAQPDSMRLFALHEALRQRFQNEDERMWGWPAWPEAYRSPEGHEVRRYADTHRTEVEYHLYLQFLAQEQLFDAIDRGKAAGCTLGVYGDLALGANGGGAEVWCNRSLYARGASMGAPPDPLGPQGQNWGLPPIVPRALQENGYRHFSEVLGFAMERMGALRIDHVMSLYRLFWIPDGRAGSEGAYVRYPFQDLLSIVALESQRRKCIIIGEDLGTVPGEVRGGMARTGALSYKVFFFMRNESEFAPRESYPKESIVVTSTHDLPTLRGYWEGRDIEHRKELGIISEPALVAASIADRSVARHTMLDALVHDGCLDAAFLEKCGFSDGEPSGNVKHADAGALEGKLDLERLTVAVHRFLAETPAMIQMVQLEDIIGELEQANLPGTVDEHPNWRRRIRGTLEAVFSSPQFQRIAQELREARG